MQGRLLASGDRAYYWQPARRDAQRGFPIRSEALGQDYAAAIRRADLLNQYLDEWRAGLGAERDIDLGSAFGTVDWWFERFKRSGAFEKLSARSQSDYRRYLDRIAEVPTTDGRRLGALPVRSITPGAVDRLYERLLTGEHGSRVRQANHEMDAARRAWDVVSRRYQDVFPDGNPFVGLERIRTTGTVTPATRAEAYALAEALRDRDHASLGAAALICFEWLQRPENVLAGWITWPDYRPPARPNHVRIRHHKTGEMVWHPLEEDGERFYPEIEEYLATVPRLGVPIVLMPNERGEPKPYSQVHPRRLIRKARKEAGLPDHVTLAACRHGGMTELGDAELTESQVMSLSAHRTPAAARLYVKRTETQRIAATKRRRAWVEENAKAGDRKRGKG